MFNDLAYKIHFNRKLPESGTHCINFATNDYLNLSRNPQLIAAAQRAALQYGVGSTGSRLLSGNSMLFENFEQQIAQAKNTQAALIFNSGFQANSTVLTCLLDQKILGARPLVFFDKGNHASLYQAIFLADAQLIRFHHFDMADLSEKLLQFQNDPRPKFIITETISSMEGDRVPLAEIASLTKAHHAFLYLDEAHATGLYGPQGYGLSTTLDLSEISHLIMGTFSKALGTSGAYVACSELIKHYLINKCFGFIYSTAPSPMVIAAAAKAWDLVQYFDEQRKHLLALSENLRNTLSHWGYNVGKSSTPIIPIIFGDEKIVMNLQRDLCQQGIRANAIRPPTVPTNKTCLRITLTAAHVQSDIDALLHVLK